MFENWPLWVVIIFFLVLIWLISVSVRVVPEYERGVVFRLGRVQGAKGPGLFFLIPLIDRMVKVDLRTVTLDVPAQETITRDNVTVKVNAVCYFRVIEPVDSVINVVNYLMATQQIAQTTLRSVLGQSELDEILAKRDQINQRLQQIIDEQTEPWGVKVSVVELKDLELPETMKRAMARQAEAERDKRAKIIYADGEQLSAGGLRMAAAELQAEPAAITLRYLQTLTDIGVDRNTTIVFPLPVDLMTTLIGAATSNAVPLPSVAIAEPAAAEEKTDL